MKKITAIVVAICMMISFLPLTGIDAQGATKPGIIKKYKFRGHIITTGGTMNFEQTDSLKEAQGMVMEYIEEVYQDEVKDRSHYCDDVWNEIEEAYENAIKAVKDAEAIRDLYSSDGLFLYLEPAIGNELEIMASLAYFIKHRVKGKVDINSMCKKFLKDVNELRSEFHREEYNDFYWGKLQNLFYDANANMKNIKSFREYVLKSSKISDAFGSLSLSGEELVISFGDDEDSILIKLIEDDDDDAFIIWDDEDGIAIHNNMEVEMARLSTVDKLKLYVTERLTQAKYTGNKKALENEIDAFKTRVLDKLEDVDAIYEAGDKRLEELIKRTGVDCPPLTRETFIEKAKEYNALTNNYNEHNYSNEQWFEVEMLFMTAKTTIENAEMEYEVNAALSNLKKELKLIPTIDKEFKNKKTAAEKTLKGFMKKGNKKKYNQSKVKVVVKKGLAALARVEKYDIEKLESEINKYVRNARNCINKFRIKTSKKGKGKITKSKTVVYGGKCTITLTPKAGYKIKKVLLNGKTTKLKNKYVFKNVKKKQKIRAIFSK